MSFLPCVGFRHYNNDPQDEDLYPKLANCEHCNETWQTQNLCVHPTKPSKLICINCYDEVLDENGINPKTMLPYTD